MTTVGKLIHVLYVFATNPDAQATFKELVALLNHARAADAATAADPGTPHPPG